MWQNNVIQKSKTAIVIMDCTNDALSYTFSTEQKKAFLKRAKKVLAAARQVSVPVIHVAVRFRDGFPEVSPRNKQFANLLVKPRCLDGSHGAEFHTEVAPQPGEVVVTKRRLGAFSTTDLESILRAKEITTLVLMGLATSGAVLSTERWASDMDYDIVILSDACADPDEDVHRILIEKMFPRQATVITVEEFLNALKNTN